LTGPEPLQPPPDVDERGYWADRVWRPWIERARPLGESTVLEYGCGPGSVSRSLVPHARRYIGLDIDPGYIAQARAQNDHESAEFHVHPAEEIGDAFSSYAGEVDVVLLYAVVEHLTIPERLDILARAREVARPDGVIVVVELPNRLVPLDHHSSFEPFLSQLPDELALDYLYRREVRRPEIRDYVTDKRDPSLPAAEDEDGLMALRRFGRGASFHEFELAWGGPVNDHVIATNWEPEVIPHRAIDPGEVALARTLRRLRPDLDPCWSRQWIDLILTPEPALRRGPFHRPWIGHPGPASRQVVPNLEDVILLPNAEARLEVVLPEATRQLAVRVVDGETQTTVRVRTARGDLIERTVPGHPGHGKTLVLDLPDWSDDVVVDLPQGGWISGVTYLGYGT
jgi:SAM-dependent methyltransferase